MSTTAGDADSFRPTLHVPSGDWDRKLCEDKNDLLRSYLWGALPALYLRLKKNRMFRDALLDKIERAPREGETPEMLNQVRRCLRGLLLLLLRFHPSNAVGGREVTIPEASFFDDSHCDSTAHDIWLIAILRQAGVLLSTIGGLRLAKRWKASVLAWVNNYWAGA